MEITLAYEGEQSDHPKDTGGFTRWGVAQRWHPNINVAALSRAECIDILEREYWFPIQGELLPWPLCVATFDHAVHSGPHAATIALQRASGASPDGIVGPLTRAAVGRAWEETPRAVLAECIRLRTRELVRAKQLDFMGGWMARVSDLSLVCGFELGLLARRRAA